ncbi:hypothetical protein Fraau_0232 [Frateuria aurantia DSM 6220]|uniref:Uncharacterized protein n=2 Tax=Frateuria aurantia TaxID=81475 RepID=H8L1K1_FRAAD|nr:hypothetical protein Fraau_0232 [Frateuria aurantia DSM 6220]
MTAETPASKADAVSLFDEISDLLKWSQDRVGPLTFVGLSIAALLWLDFLKVFALPVGFLSSSSLAALPALFSVVVFLIIAMTLVICLPSMPLWMPLIEGGPSIGTLGRGRFAAEAEKDGAASGFRQLPETEAAVVRRRMLRQWLGFNGGVVMFSLLWVGSLFELSPRPTWFWWLGAVAIGVAMALIMLAWQLKKKLGRWPSIEFALILLGAGLVQGTISLFLIQVLLNVIALQSSRMLVVAAIIYLVVMALIILLQALVAMRIIKGMYRGGLKHVMVSVLLILVAVAAVPQAGARLVSYPLQLATVDGETCQVLTLLPLSSAAPSSYATVQDLNNPGHSVPLNFITHLDGMYYVRPDPWKGAVYAVPEASVGGIGPCRAREEASPIFAALRASDGSPP